MPMVTCRKVYVIDNDIMIEQSVAIEINRHLTDPWPWMDGNLERMRYV
jgi:hypothetical protein